MNSKSLAGLAAALLGSGLLIIAGFAYSSAAPDALRQAATPSPPLAVVTTLDGQQIQLTDIGWGIPLESGRNVYFLYINHVAVGEPDEDDPYWRDIVITLADGDELQDRVSGDVEISGGWSLGSFQTDLSNVNTIEIRREPGQVPQPTPMPTYPEYVITTVEGAEVRVTSLSFDLNSYTVPTPLGIPLRNGLEVDLDYVDRVDFAQDETGEPEAIITLTNGETLEGYLTDWKADTEIHANWSLGSFERHLLRSDGVPFLQSIEVVRGTEPAAAPVDLAAEFDTIATLFYPDGSSLDVGNLRFEVSCTHGNWCCYGGEFGYLPTSEGYQLEFPMIREIEFLHDQTTEDNFLPVRVTALDGQAFEFHTQPTECEYSRWRLLGVAALGRVHVLVNSVSRIVFETQSDSGA